MIRSGLHSWKTSEAGATLLPPETMESGCATAVALVEVAIVDRPVEPPDGLQPEGECDRDPP